MPAFFIMNYTQIVNAVKAYSGRTDGEGLTNIPGFIAQAQAKLDQILRIAPTLKLVEQPQAVSQFDMTGVLQVETVFINDMEGDLTTVKTVMNARRLPHYQPNLYAMSGASILLPAPATVSVHGYVRPTPISSTLAENEYSTYAPNAIIWLALVYLSVWAMDDENLSKYQQLAADEVESLNDASQALSLTGTIHAIEAGYV